MQCITHFYYTKDKKSKKKDLKLKRVAASTFFDCWWKLIVVGDEK
jgi:hypothetical protein